MAVNLIFRFQKKKQLFSIVSGLLYVKTYIANLEQCSVISKPMIFKEMHKRQI